MEEIIREEIAQHFAKEINKAEIQFRAKIAQIEKQYNDNVTQLTDVLKLKTREVASLQGVIERANLKDVFFKLSEYEKMSIQNEQAQNEYRRNLEKCQQHISKLNVEVQHLREQEQAVIEVADLKDKFVGTLKEYDRLKEKYKVLKKTALKYKVSIYTYLTTFPTLCSCLFPYHCRMVMQPKQPIILPTYFLVYK